MRINTKRPPTILVVDDEPQLVDLIASFLRKTGYEVLEAETPADAISLCAEADWPIDLVVSDFNMPGLNGIQLAKNLRSIRPNLQFIFMSASPAAFEEITAEGHICLAKPFPIPELLSSICERLKPAR